MLVKGIKRSRVITISAKKKLRTFFEGLTSESIQILRPFSDVYPVFAHYHTLFLLYFTGHIITEANDYVNTIIFDHKNI